MKNLRKEIERLETEIIVASPKRAAKLTRKIVKLKKKIFK